MLENLNRADSIPATGVVITEVLPDDTLFYTAYPPSLATYYPALGAVQWALTQTVPVNSVTYVTLTVRIAPEASYTTISNPKANCYVRADHLPSLAEPEPNRFHFCQVLVYFSPNLTLRSLGWKLDFCPTNIKIRFRGFCIAMTA